MQVSELMNAKSNLYLEVTDKSFEQSLMDALNKHRC